MKLLYYYWGELIADVAEKAFDSLGIEIKRISPQRILYDFDVQFMEAVRTEFEGKNKGDQYDAVFSFNYFPDLSRIAEECGIKYVSWVYDSPHLTLESLTLNNVCNKVYIFDYALYEKYKSAGIKTVEYIPLPARIVELPSDIEYEHEITFIGNLYDGEQDLYGQIKTLPGYLEGYIDALIKSQQLIYGADIFDSLVQGEIFNEIKKYVKSGLGENYNSCDDVIFKDMLRRKVTSNERIEVLKRLGNALGCIDLYCGKEHPELPVKNCGFADYNSEMPRIFQKSKINLNISLRSIQTGIPLRVMDILGAGGFCISNYQAELAEYFENGIDIVWYESIDDLETKCRYYLEHEEERRQIAINGQKKVRELFAYGVLLKRVLDI